VRADLFTWKDEQEALADVDAAHRARAEAARKLRCAPYGQIRQREAALRQATAEALRAEAYLDRVKGIVH